MSNTDEKSYPEFDSAAMTVFLKERVDKSAALLVKNSATPLVNDGVERTNEELKVAEIEAAKAAVVAGLFDVGAAPR